MSNIQIDANNRITIKGAREHNLKNVNLVLPRNKLIVMTGLSGKSSLAFDTIFADGQRRYMESLSSYARMFLGQMEKPDVDEITGLSPAVSIDQKTTSHNPRSTVGTVTEIYDYLRLMYARIGVPHCPVCGRVISQQTVDEMVDEVLKLPERTRFQVLAPVVRGRKGTQAKELDAARRGGYARVRIDGNMYDLDEEIKLEKNIKHTVEGFGNVYRVLTEHGIDYEKNFIGGYRCLYVLKFLHHFFIDMKTSGGVDEYDIVTMPLCMFNARLCNFDRRNIDSH